MDSVKHKTGRKVEDKYIIDYAQVARDKWQSVPEHYAIYRGTTYVDEVCNMAETGRVAIVKQADRVFDPQGQTKFLKGDGSASIENQLQKQISENEPAIDKKYIGKSGAYVGFKTIDTDFVSGAFNKPWGDFTSKGFVILAISPEVAKYYGGNTQTEAVEAYKKDYNQGLYPIFSGQTREGGDEALVPAGTPFVKENSGAVVNGKIISLQKYCQYLKDKFHEEIPKEYCIEFPKDEKCDKIKFSDHNMLRGNDHQQVLAPHAEDYHVATLGEHAQHPAFIEAA